MHGVASFIKTKLSVYFLKLNNLLFVVKASALRTSSFIRDSKGAVPHTLGRAGEVRHTGENEVTAKPCSFCRKQTNLLISIGPLALF